MPIWTKNKPIYFQGEMALNPWAGAGTEEVNEIVIPLNEMAHPMQVGGIIFYPFLRVSGAIRWLYTYRVIPEWRKPAEYGFTKI